MESKNITGNGTIQLPTKQPGSYIVRLTGTPDGASVAIKWNDGVNSAVDYADSPLTAAGGFIAAAGTGTIDFVTTSAGASTDLNASIERIGN